MNLLSYAAWNRTDSWGFWFRIFGRGLHVTNAAPLFSERYGYSKSFRVFGVKVEYLPRQKILSHSSELKFLVSNQAPTAIVIHGYDQHGKRISEEVAVPKDGGVVTSKNVFFNER